MPSGTETILLVEDDQQVRALTREILTNAGYLVLEAENGEEALLVSERHQGPIHLLVADVVMPHMSGQKLASRLAGLRPNMAVLYMSGYGEDPHRHEMAGASPLLDKPFTQEELLRKVRQGLDRANSG